MTTLPLFADEPAKSLTEQVADLFQSQPREWISMQRLAEVGGTGGWRTRVSNLRYPPFQMVIENRHFRKGLGDGRVVTVSEYRFIP